MERTNRNVKVEKNKLGVIEKIGHRSSGRYFRIYEDTENKKFEKFEDSLYFDLIREFGKLLPLKYPYVDWLVEELRQFRKGNKQLTGSGMKTDYIVNKDLGTLKERKKFWNLLQFLNFVEELNYQTDSLGNTRYRLFRFPVKRFLEYTNQSKNHYQLKKIIKFFDELQVNSLVRYFSKSYYRSLVTIPEVTLFSGKQNQWMVDVWVAEKLFDYSYPFLFPDFFQQKLSKHQFEVIFYITQIFAFEDLEKVFWIKDYFKNYPSSLSYSDQEKIKKFFLEVLEKLKKDNLIEDKFTIMEKGHTFKTKKLASKHLNEGFIIIEKLEIEFP